MHRWHSVEHLELGVFYYPLSPPECGRSVRVSSAAPSHPWCSRTVFVRRERSCDPPRKQVHDDVCRLLPAYSSPAHVWSLSLHESVVVVNIRRHTATTLLLPFSHAVFFSNTISLMTVPLPKNASAIVGTAARGHGAANVTTVPPTAPASVLQWGWIRVTTFVTIVILCQVVLHTPWLLQSGVKAAPSNHGQVR